MPQRGNRIKPGIIHVVDEIEMQTSLTLPGCSWTAHCPHSAPSGWTSRATGQSRLPAPTQMWPGLDGDGGAFGHRPTEAASGHRPTEGAPGIPPTDPRNADLAVVLDPADMIRELQSDCCSWIDKYDDNDVEEFDWFSTLFRIKTQLSNIFLFYFSALPSFSTSRCRDRHLVVFWW